MQYNAIDNIILHSHFIITKIVDGDGLFVKNIFTNEEIEIRFYGIDAPEMKKCKKLIQDERETHIAGSLLIKLGIISYKYLREVAPVGSNCSLIQEPENTEDIYGRHLAYVMLENGTILNEIMIKEGFAKPYNKVFCQALPKYQEFNLIARQQKKGLYSMVNFF